MIDIVLIIIPIFIIILLGNVLRRVNLLNDIFIDTGNKLIMNVLLPVLLFYKISQSNFTEIFSALHVAVMLFSIFFIFVVSFPLAKILRLPDSVTGTFVSSNFRTNAVFIGLPVCYFIFGDRGLTVASILVAFIVPINNILGVLAFSTCGFRFYQIIRALRKTCLNPLVFSSAAGVFFAVFNISLPGFIENTLSILSGITLPMALLGIGATIKLQDLKGNSCVIAISSVFKLILLPLTAYFLFKWFHYTTFGLLEKVVIVLLAAPSAQINYVFASTMNGDSNLASGTIVTSTILSVFSFVIWLKILQISAVI